MTSFIYGVQPVRELIRHRSQEVKELIISRGRSHLEEIINLAQEKGIKIRWLSSQELDQLTRTKEHQGIAVLAPLPKTFTLEEILKRTETKTESLLIFLDQIEDPQNLGAIIRSAEGAGAEGVIIPERRSARLTPAVLKASAGALEWLPLIIVPNLVQALRKTKDAGYWVYSAMPNAKQNFWEVEFSPKSVIIIGSEGKGIRPLVAKTADFEIRIPVLGKVSSLNASVASALILYEYRRQRLAK